MSESHLSVIIDISPSQWHLSSLPLDLFISQLLTFLNAHIALKHENSLAVFAALPGKSVMLYASSDPQNHSQPIDPNAYQPFKSLDSTVVSRISQELDLLSQEEEAPSALVGALTKALCYINRISLGSTALNHVVDPRILILSVSPDLSTSYIPIMNSIFSAQKLKVTIDACQIFGPDTVFLQQAAHLTGGAYLYLERRDALLQYLIMTFLPPSSIRKVLAIPTQDRIDFRAACFCHKNIIDIGFVCSVCLSIFCQPVPVCSTCRTKFPIKTLQRLNAFRPMVPAVTNSARPSPVTTPQTRPSPAEPTHPRITASGENSQNSTQLTTNGSQH
ncbi:Tfb4-domain-containing protein [Phlegmacium glaucopus]|nr:Tfb4-domain-containing protein [Phlegmacium glaucopus]